MPFAQTVTDAARDLKLLDGGGNLVLLDSLTIIDLIAELEARTNLVIPTSEIRNEVFANVGSIAQLLDKLAAESS